MMSNKLKIGTLSILIPVYNEQSYLRQIVGRVMEAPLPGNLEKELVIVNDASKDRTSLVIADLCEKYPKIKAFEQPVNMGKGAAIRRAITEMSGQFAIIQDADLEYDPKDYVTILSPLVDGLADVVYGSRFATRKMRRIVHYHHKLGNLFLTHLSNWTTGLDLTDMETCYKAFRSELVKSIPLHSNRFGIEPELTAKLAKRGAVFYEVPISYHGRKYEEGKKIGWIDGVSAIWTIFKYWLIDDCFFEDRRKSSSQSLDEVRCYRKWSGKILSKQCGAKILEIGSAQGGKSRYLPQREKLTLTENDPDALETLRNQYEGNATVEVREWDTEMADIGTYDSVVVCNAQVLCHNEERLLKQAGHFLNENGKLILLLPQYEYLGSPVEQKTGNFPRWTRNQIKKTLSTAGYDVISCRSWNCVSWLLRFIHFTLLRRKQIGKISLKIYNTLIPISAFFERFLPLPGSDLLVVAQWKKTAVQEKF